MKLLAAPASPFVRKVRICAALKGVAGSIEVVATDTSTPDAALAAANPLGKIPALILDDGTTLYDSHVICEYLDLLGNAAPLFPADPMARVLTLRSAALADGIMEAAVLIVYEGRFRTPEQRVESWVARQQDKVDRGLDFLESNPPPSSAAPDYADVSIACTLGYLDLRFGGAWRATRPSLASWLDRFAVEIPAFAATHPPG